MKQAELEKPVIREGGDKSCSSKEGNSSEKWLKTQVCSETKHEAETRLPLLATGSSTPHGPFRFLIRWRVTWLTSHSASCDPTDGASQSHGGVNERKEGWHRSLLGGAESRRGVFVLWVSGGHLTSEQQRGGGVTGRKTPHWFPDSHSRNPPQLHMADLHKHGLIQKYVTTTNKTFWLLHLVHAQAGRLCLKTPLLCLLSSFALVYIKEQTLHKSKLINQQKKLYTLWSQFRSKSRNSQGMQLKSSFTQICNTGHVIKDTQLQLFRSH